MSLQILIHEGQEVAYFRYTQAAFLAASCLNVLGLPLEEAIRIGKEEDQELSNVKK